MVQLDLFTGAGPTSAPPPPVSRRPRPGAPPAGAPALPADWRERWALHASAHSYTGAAERWAERRARGLTDEELREALAREFGIFGGRTGIEHGEHLDCWHRGERSPACGLGLTPTTEGATTLKGAALLRLAREVLGVPFPAA